MTSPVGSSITVQEIVKATAYDSRNSKQKRTSTMVSTTSPGGRKNGAKRKASLSGFSSKPVLSQIKGRHKRNSSRTANPKRRAKLPNSNGLTLEEKKVVLIALQKKVTTRHQDGPTYFNKAGQLYQEWQYLAPVIKQHRERISQERKEGLKGAEDGNLAADGADEGDSNNKSSCSSDESSVESEIILADLSQTSRNRPSTRSAQKDVGDREARHLREPCTTCQKRKIKCEPTNFGSACKGCSSLKHGGFWNCSFLTQADSRLGRMEKPKRTNGAGNLQSSSSERAPANPENVPGNQMPEHGNELRNFSAPSNLCKECQQKDCSCTARSCATEIILCCGPSKGFACPQLEFSGQYLETYCGVKLEEVQTILRSTGTWLCPTCSYKEGKLRESNGPGQSAMDKIPSLFGRDRLNDQDVRSSLERLDNITLQYIAMAKKKTGLLVLQSSFLDLPFVHDETLPNCDQLVRILRETLDAPKGVSLRSQALTQELQYLTPGDFLRGVLARLYLKALTQMPLIFGDATIWRETLKYSFSNEIASMMIQDQRRRMLQIPSFANLSRSRVETWVAIFNSIMVPLIGASSEIDGFHEEMVRVIGNMSDMLHSYHGEKNLIWPRIRDRFDADVHALDRQDRAYEGTPEGSIEWVTMLGVRYRPHGKDWRTCSQAKVMLRDVAQKKIYSDVRTSFNSSNSTFSNKFCGQKRGPHP